MSDEPPFRTHTLFELRQLASAAIQIIAQARALLSEPDASTYLDYITIGVHALRKGSLLTVGDDEQDTAAFVVTDGQNYFVDEGAFMTRWVGDRRKAQQFITRELAERAARRLGKGCHVETIEDEETP